MNIEEIVKQLLDSDISAYRIAKDTGVSNRLLLGYAMVTERLINLRWNCTKIN